VSGVAGLLPDEATLNRLAGEFFAALPGVAASHEHAFTSAYVTRLFPAYRVETGIAERARALAADEGDRLPSLRRLLLEAADDLERAVACRAVAAG